MRVTCRHLEAAATSLKPRMSTTHPTPYSWVNPVTVASSAGPLAGRTIAIKDNISYTSAPSSCSSSILRDYNPPYDATCVKSLVRAGARIAGQTKMDEFGMGSLTTHLPSHCTPVHNPASPTEDEPPRSAGGSSGGSAAAVAEGSVWVALGTDTGGSVRLPASYCGVVGLKPSYGMISRRGVVSYADSLDCVGILARDVGSVQGVFDIISHPDEGDMTCVSSSARAKASSILSDHLASSLSPLVHPSETEREIAGLRIGIPENTLDSPPELLSYLQSKGAIVQRVSIPSLQLALPAYYVLASAEASSNLGRFGGGWYGSPFERDARNDTESGVERRRRIRTEGFGAEVKKRILAGTYALSADEFNNTYLKALQLRRLLRRDYQTLFRIPHPLQTSQLPNTTPKSEGVDIILHPTAICTAPLLDSSPSDEHKKHTVKGSEEYAQDLLTVPASLAGLPAMSVPAGRGEDGWPVGISVTSQWGMEGLVFRLGKVIEGWTKGT
ncbi:aspartyl-tRNA(Asn)/glutamyl-tRNA (Gln) amidotransferase subunit A [Kwoniella heveanensis CBS 569]|nr:aspartyl-tRNA(Asn)/glutamyl-tRNA (Gln) amidotransferase subunit A [Kwoniella heveanensis CBS 569]